MYVYDYMKLKNCSLTRLLLPLERKNFFSLPITLLAFAAGVVSVSVVFGINVSGIHICIYISVYNGC